MVIASLIIDCQHHHDLQSQVKWWVQPCWVTRKWLLLFSFLGLNSLFIQFIQSFTLSLQSFLWVVRGSISSCQVHAMTWHLDKRDGDTDGNNDSQRQLFLSPPKFATNSPSARSVVTRHWLMTVQWDDGWKIFCSIAFQLGRTNFYPLGLIYLPFHPSLDVLQMTE